MKLGKIRALIYAIVFLSTVAFVVLLMALFNRYNRNFRRTWAKFQRFCIGYKIEQIGEFSNQANMIILNHQSILDIIALEETHPANLCWIAKKEIGKIPIIGKILSLPKMIAVDRENPRDLVRIVREVEDRVANNRVIAIFPEGTRRKGKKLLKFQSGAKVIAEKLNLKVQPIVLVGTKEIMDSHEFSLNRGDIKIVCLDLVDTTDKNWLENARNLMQETLDKFDNEFSENATENSTTKNSENSENS